MRASVIEVFALEMDLRAPQLTAQAIGVINRARPTDEIGQFATELSFEGVVVAIVFVDLVELLERIDQCLGHKGAAIGAKVASGVGLLIIQHVTLKELSVRIRRMTDRPHARPDRTRASARRL